MAWTKKELEREMDYAEFLKDLEQFKAWVRPGEIERKRTRRAWLFSMWRWAEGDH